ncbi:hypothetical protein [Cellulophaga sp. BC115SP]|uniref:hypothetical protein n=1 Tax=Cellulophaga sp. BC115SP TaxID=2683263 RepID=UPI0014135B6A|nr:hypothetical protein [Cellulophaga sp. BC115SP]NBB27000.1 hypothetical protein [Cellulophaga sp. BC115SP]
MQTLAIELTKSAFFQLASSTQDRICQIQSLQIQKSLVQVRGQKAMIKETIQTQKLANNPCLKLEDKLHELQRHEQILWVELQTRAMMKAW